MELSNVRKDFLNIQIIKSLVANNFICPMILVEATVYSSGEFQHATVASGMDADKREYRTS